MSSRIRVLVVDDSAYSRQAIARMLRSSPLVEVVGVARDGDEGLRKVFELEPDAPARSLRPGDHVFIPAGQRHRVLSATPDALPSPRMSRVAKIALIRREVRYSLSPSAVEALFGRAELVVEGSPELNGRGRGPRELYATVMVTLDLRRQ